MCAVQNGLGSVEQSEQDQYMLSVLLDDCGLFRSSLKLESKAAVSARPQAPKIQEMTTRETAMLPCRVQGETEHHSELACLLLACHCFRLPIVVDSHKHAQTHVKDGAKR